MNQKSQNKFSSVDAANKSVYQHVLLPDDDLHKRFNQFVSEVCIVRPDVEENSVNIEGRYRLWSQLKPTKEAYHALKSYLDIRFKPKRIRCSHHGYAGIKLKEVEYKKSTHNSVVETFIFQVCQFSDTGKILNSVLLTEYRKWKISVDRVVNEHDMKEIKEYLNSSPYALKATVWTAEGNNEGYYGLSLKRDEYNIKDICSTTGKVVYKRQTETNLLLGTWDSIKSAALAEGFSPAKMSRCVKNENIIEDYYFTTNTVHK